MESVGRGAPAGGGGGLEIDHHLRLAHRLKELATRPHGLGRPRGPRKVTEAPHRGGELRRARGWCDERAPAVRVAAVQGEMEQQEREVEPLLSVADRLKPGCPVQTGRKEARETD